MTDDRRMKFQLWATMLISLHFIAHWITGHVNMMYVVIMVIGTPLAVFAFISVLRMMTPGQSSAMRALAEYDQYLSGLTLEDARGKSSVVLQNKRMFEIIPASEPANVEASLSPALLKFFRDYQSVSAVNGDLRLQRSAIGPSTRIPGHIKIGTDSMGSEIVADSHKDKIMVIDVGAEEDPDVESHPSIYHLILSRSNLLYGYDVRKV